MICSRDQVQRFACMTQSPPDLMNGGRNRGVEGCVKERVASGRLLPMSVYASAEYLGKESPKIAERPMTPAVVLIAVGASFRAHLAGGLLFACEAQAAFGAPTPRAIFRKS
jgi:hypothetical protein